MWLFVSKKTITEVVELPHKNMKTKPIVIISEVKTKVTMHMAVDN